MARACLFAVVSVVEFAGFVVRDFFFLRNDAFLSYMVTFYSVFSPTFVQSTNMDVATDDVETTDACGTLLSAADMIDSLIALVDMDCPPWTYSDALRERRQIFQQLLELKHTFDAERVGKPDVHE